MNNIIYNKAFIIAILFMIIQGANSQQKINLHLGFFYNGTGFSDDAKGFGAILGLELCTQKTVF